MAVGKGKNVKKGTKGFVETTPTKPIAPTARVKVSKLSQEVDTAEPKLVAPSLPYGQHTNTIETLLSHAELLTPSLCLTMLALHPDSEYLKRKAAQGKAFRACDWKSEAFQNLHQLAWKATDLASRRCQDNSINTLMTEGLKYACIAIWAGDKITAEERSLLLKGWEWVFPSKIIPAV